VKKFEFAKYVTYCINFELFVFQASLFGKLANSLLSYIRRNPKRNSHYTTAEESAFCRSVPGGQHSSKAMKSCKA